MSEVEVPLSPAAQDAKEVMQQELLRNVAKKMMVAAEEEERQRRITDLQEMQSPKESPEQEDTLRRNAYEQLMIVQEDLVRSMNLMKANSEMKFEKAQRETEVKKAHVHSELLRKSAAKEADKAMDEERERREMEDKSAFDQEKKDVYGKLVIVQEDLLKTLRKMKVDEEVRLEQEHRVLEGHKKFIHEELVHSVNEKVANSLMEDERKRRTEDIGDKEIQRRVAIANRLLDVQKELLATHKEVKGIRGTVSQAALEETKAFYQEQLVRKAAQKEAITAMDEEQKRRISESNGHTISDTQAIVLEEISRKSSIKQAKEQAENTQRHYIQAEAKAHVQAETVRKVNQKSADMAMDAEKAERIMEDTPRKPIDEAMKSEIESHSK